MNQLKHTLLITLSLLFAVSCSQQWREADAGVSGEQVLNLLGDSVNKAGISLSSGGGSSSSLLAELMDGDYGYAKTIYFSQYPGTLGSLESVLAISDFGFLSPTYSGMGTYDVGFDEAKVFFVDGFTSEGERRFMLILDVKPSGASSSIVEVYEDERNFISKDELVIVMKSGGEEKLTLGTFDMVEGSDELAGVIQLKVADFDADGLERPIGKFSTLVGFGQ